MTSGRNSQINKNLERKLTIDVLLSDSYIDVNIKVSQVILLYCKH